MPRNAAAQGRGKGQNEHGFSTPCPSSLDIFMVKPETRDTQLRLCGPPALCKLRGVPLRLWEEAGPKGSAFFFVMWTGVGAPFGSALSPASAHVMKIQNGKKRKKRFFANGLIPIAESTRE